MSEFWAFLVGVAVSALFLGGCFAEHWQKEAIKHGYAHYDSKTAEWQWNNQGEQK